MRRTANVDMLGRGEVCLKRFLFQSKSKKNLEIGNCNHEKSHRNCFGNVAKLAFKALTSVTDLFSRNYGKEFPS